MDRPWDSRIEGNMYLFERREYAVCVSFTQRKRYGSGGRSTQYRERLLRMGLGKVDHSLFWLKAMVIRRSFRSQSL